MFPIDLASGAERLTALAGLLDLRHVPLAYLDPGTGSLLIQALIAGIVAVPFLLRRKIAAGIDRLRGRRHETTIQTAAPAVPDDADRLAGH